MPNIHHLQEVLLLFFCANKTVTAALREQRNFAVKRHICGAFRFTRYAKDDTREIKLVMATVEMILPDALVSWPIFT